MPVQDDLLLRGLAGTDEQLLGISTPTRYRVFVRNTSYQIVDELTDWISLKLVLRFNRTGTWTLEISRDSPSAQLVTKTAGIVVRRNDVTIFSGSVATEWERTATTLRAAGFDDMTLLETPARPTPSLASGPYPDEYWVRQGVASTIMRELVDVNIGPEAPAGWMIDALTLGPDPLLGNDDPLPTMRARFDPIITLLAEFAVSPYAGGLRFTLLQSDTTPGALEFNVVAPADRTTDAVFSVELDTARDFRDTWQFPQGNYFMVAGGDALGADRTIVEGGDLDNIAEVGRRIARFIDARGVTDTSELQQRLAEAIAGAVSARQVTIEPFAVPSLEFGTDFDMGDVVTFVIDGESFQDVIREVEIDLTTDRGAVIVPMMGNAGTTNDDRLARYVATVADRIGNIERNWNVPDNSVIWTMLHDLVKPPIGEIRSFAGSVAPPGWLLCNGSHLLISEYPALFAAIGTTWGGNGLTHFALPNFAGRMLMGSGGGFTVGQLGGTNAGYPHTHPQSHSHGLDPHDHASGDYQTEGSVLTSNEDNRAEVESGTGEEVADNFHQHALPTIDVQGTSSTGQFENTANPFDSTQGDSNVGVASYTSDDNRPPYAVVGVYVYSGIAA